MTQVHIPNKILYIASEIKKKNQYLMLIVEEAGRSTCQSSDLLIILGYDLFSHKQLSSKSNLYV